MELALAVAMGAIAYAWSWEAHRKSFLAPILALMFFVFMAVLLREYWISM